MDQEQQKTSSGQAANFFSPEAVIMLPIAVIIDVIGVICVILFLFKFPQFVTWIADIIGLLIIAPWILMRTVSAKMLGGKEPEVSVSELPEKIADKRAKVAEAQKAMQEAQKAAQEAARTAQKGARVGAKGLRILGVFLVQIIPIIGALPLWIWLVYEELKES